MYKNVHTITIHNGPKLETTKMPTNGRMERTDKYIVIKPYNGVQQ